MPAPVAILHSGIFGFCLGYWDTWILGYLDSGILGFWDTWILGYLDSGILGFWDTWIHHAQAPDSAIVSKYAASATATIESQCSMVVLPETYYGTDQQLAVAPSPSAKEDLDCR
jgi:hypothetical protein